MSIHKRPKKIQENYLSFSGTDAVSTILLPKAPPIILGTLKALSYSTLRPIIPSPALGKRYIPGFARGFSTVAGTLIFNSSWNQHWIRDISASVSYLSPRIKPDELPPFHMQIVVANEYGASSGYAIFGMRFVDEGQVTSDQDVVTENVATFEAQNFLPMQSFSHTTYETFRETVNQKSAQTERLGILRPF